MLLHEVLAELIPDILLVDIEGEEVELFEGAESLGNVDRIVLESSRTNLRRRWFRWDVEAFHGVMPIGLCIWPAGLASQIPRPAPAAWRSRGGQVWRHLRVRGPTECTEWTASRVDATNVQFRSLLARGAGENSSFSMLARHRDFNQKWV